MAETPKEATIIDVRDMPSPDPKRLGKMDKVIVYEIAGAGRYVCRVTSEPLTDQAVADAVRKDVAERSKHVGKTVKL